MRRTALAIAGLGASLALIVGLIGFVGLGGASASTPPEQKVTLPSTPGTYSYKWTGNVPPGATGAKGQADKSPCVGNADAEDAHKLFFALANSRVYKEANIAFTFQIQWDNSIDAVAVDATDTAMNVLGPGGTSVGQSDGGTTTETVKLGNLDEGPYTVLVCGFSRALPEEYRGMLEMVVTSKAKKPATSTASKAGTPSSGSSGGGVPMSPRAPAATVKPYSPAVGAGRVAPTAAPTVTPGEPSAIEAAPSAFRGLGETGVQNAAPPVLTNNTKKVARVPLWLLIVCIAAGIALLVVGLLARRRRGLDRAPGTAVVPVLAEG